MTAKGKRLAQARATYQRPPCELCRQVTWPDWGRCIQCAHYFCTPCRKTHGCGTDFKSFEQRAAEAQAARDEAEAKRITPDFGAAVAAMREKLTVQPAGEEHARTLRTMIFPRLKAYGWEERFFTECSGDWGCATQAARFARCGELFTGAGAIVALVGPRGVGKTTIGFQLALQRALACWQAYLAPAPGQPRGLTWQLTPYVKLTDLLARFKALYADFGTVDPERLVKAREAFCREDALAVIDEIHECDELRTAPRLLTDLLDRRYAAKRDTLLITNQTAEEFAASIGDSIYSRLTEHGAILRCEWKSWRERK